MSNKMDSTRKEETIITTNNQDVTQKTASQNADDSHREEFNELVIDAGRSVIKNLKENADDYKAISEDPHMSPVDKALGKRKVIAADIGLGTLTLGCMICLVKLARKIL